MSAIGNLLKHLFGPVAAEVREPKGLGAHVKSYLGTVDGSQAIFDITAAVFQSISMSSSSSSAVVDAAVKAQAVFEKASMALDLPGILVNPSVFGNSVVSIVFPSTYTMRSLSRRVLDCTLDGAGLVRSCVKLPLFAAATSICKIAAVPLWRLSVVSTSATLLIDMADLVRDCAILARDDHRDETALLALLNVVKNVASVAAGILVLAGLGIGFSSGLTIAVLGCGFVFSAARVSSYFFEKMVVDALLLSDPA